jgi:hypothetical protein
MPLRCSRWSTSPAPAWRSRSAAGPVPHERGSGAGRPAYGTDSAGAAHAMSQTAGGATPLTALSALACSGQSWSNHAGEPRALRPDGTAFGLDTRNVTCGRPRWRWYVHQLTVDVETEHGKRLASARRRSRCWRQGLHRPADDQQPRDVDAPPTGASTSRRFDWAGQTTSRARCARCSWPGHGWTRRAANTSTRSAPPRAPSSRRFHRARGRTPGARSRPRMAPGRRWPGSKASSAHAGCTSSPTPSTAVAKTWRASSPSTRASRWSPRPMARSMRRPSTSGSPPRT